MTGHSHGAGDEALVDLSIHRVEARTLLRLVQAERRRRHRQLDSRARRGIVFVPAPGHIDMSVVIDQRLARLEAQLGRAAEPALEEATS